MPQLNGWEMATGELAQGDGWDTRDADFRKSLMKMIYRKLPKTASLPVTCHPASDLGICP